ncbi:MarR family winged helix-turn-helix transcriptional regulator [Streptomyces sp. NPDC015232]|uniref:MarR family winged helix-turn-helix transcriptional regulator n=1 Tax=unclassified Streptomyces TaxID=2593676 RepID=UPI0033AB4CF7
MNEGEHRLEAWRALLLAHSAAVRAIESDVARNGTIPLTWYDVLLEVRSGGDQGLRMQEVAERVVLSRTRVSRLVDEMARAGLVTKRPDPMDKRVTWAVITDAGRAAIHATAPAYMAGIWEHFSRHLTDEESSVIAEALLRVAQAPQEIRLG